MIIHAMQTVLHLIKKYLSVWCTITAYTITYSEYFLYKWSTRLQSMHNLMVGCRLQAASVVTPFYFILLEIPHKSDKFHKLKNCLFCTHLSFSSIVFIFFSRIIILQSLIKANCYRIQFLIVGSWQYFCDLRPNFKEFEPWLKFKHRLKYGWFPKIVFNFSRFDETWQLRDCLKIVFDLEWFAVSIRLPCLSKSDSWDTGQKIL